MKCQQCGAEVVEESTFCHKCGNRISEGDPISHPDAPASIPLPSSRSAGSPLADEPRDDLAEALTGKGPSRRDEPEEHLWEGGYSPRAMIGPWIGAGLATVAGLAVAVVYGGWLYIVCGLILLWIVLGLMLAYRRLSVKYRLTTQRFFHETGILRRTTDRIEVIDMDDITFIQGPVERMLGIGSIKVTSSDRTHPEIDLVGIEKVQSVASMIDDARRAERLRRGIHIESI